MFAKILPVVAFLLVLTHDSGLGQQPTPQVKSAGAKSIPSRANCDFLQYGKSITVYKGATRRRYRLINQPKTQNPTGLLVDFDEQREEVPTSPNASSGTPRGIL